MNNSPLAMQKGVRGTQFTKAAPHAASPPLNVLLIEDNPGDARLVQLMLSEAGNSTFQLEHVGRLAAGLERLSKGGVGLVLTDLSLPDSHGLETFEMNHADSPHVPIIVSSNL